MSPALYSQWKRGIVAEAFRHRGIAADIRPLQHVGLHSRRRAFLGVAVKGDAVTIGFREEGQHTLVDLEECPVLDGAIVAPFASLKAMAKIAMPKGETGRLVVTKLDHGIDVAFDNGHKSLMPEQRAKLALMARESQIVRLMVAGDVIVERGRPVLTIGGVEISPPPSIFLQAVPEAEALLTHHVLEALPKKAKHAADLFSGVGTFTFPLAKRLKVDAFDSDRRAIGALEEGAKHATGLKPISARVRDLFREPLSARELAQYDVVVFDPPRAGAAEQAERLAKSNVPLVISVSCSAATLARDARLLIDGGYEMGPITPVDQFLYSPHVELIAVFRH
jgi:23S rRNA (uracil1939-C5)-methyltransferase